MAHLTSVVYTYILYNLYIYIYMILKWVWYTVVGCRVINRIAIFVVDVPI